MASGSDPNFLLYPDLMSENQLISVLKQRYIQIDSLEFLDKDGLVELYNKYILPLPQRKYRMNRRGREMTKKQILASKKKRLTSSDNSNGEPKTKRHNSGKLLSSFETPSSGGDRLKPPPSCIDTQKKTIKLNHTVKSDNSAISSTADKVQTNIINHTSINTSTASVKKIKLKRSSQIGASNVGEMLPLETIETVDQNDQHTEISASTETEEPPRKKIKRISWP